MIKSGGLKLQALLFQCGSVQIPYGEKNTLFLNFFKKGKSSNEVPWWRHVALQVLCVDDAGARVLAGLQLHRGHEPAAGTRGVVVEGGAVSVLGVFWVDDGGALVADGLLPRLQVHLCLVASPSGVLHRHHRLAEGSGHGNRDAHHPVSVVLVGVVLDCRRAPERERGARLGTCRWLHERERTDCMMTNLISCSGLVLTSMLSP